MKYRMEICSAEFSMMDGTLFNMYNMLAEYLKIPDDCCRDYYGPHGEDGTDDDPLYVDCCSAFEASYKSVSVYASEYYSDKFGTTDTTLCVTFSDISLILSLHRLMKERDCETYTSIIG